MIAGSSLSPLRKGCRLNRTHRSSDNAPATSPATKVLLDADPFLVVDPQQKWGYRDWPASWVHLPSVGEPPFVLAYRLAFDAAREERVRIHVTADERYELFFDGQRIGRGPERGDGRNWFYDTYALRLTAGRHVLVARVWSLGRKDMLAPLAQMSVQPGFLLAADAVSEGWGDRLNTGVAAWEAKRLGGYRFVPPGQFKLGTPFIGAGEKIDAAEFAWGFERGEGEGWQAVTKGNPGSSRAVPWGEFNWVHVLRPALLPAQLDEARRVGRTRYAGRLPDGEPKAEAAMVRAAESDTGVAARFDALLCGEGGFEAPANTRLRLIVDLEDYYCAYPELVARGGAGAKVRLHWAESLFLAPKGEARDKGNRDEVDGKFFYGFGDTWKLDGGADRRFQPLWWRAGRYVELLIETADEPATIESLTQYETRLPFEPESRFDSDDERFARTAPLLVRGLQMCMHETYFDCPYYEQLMYTGDTRVEVLTTYALTRDDRLPRKAVEAYSWSRTPDGFTQARYPSWSAQVIPPFSLWWVCMVHDYAMWRGERGLVAKALPGVRSVLEAYRALADERGLIGAGHGWNFVDWTEAWTKRFQGATDTGHSGVGGPVNWQVVLALLAKAELEAWIGDKALAKRDRAAAEKLAGVLVDALWSEERGMLADDLEHRYFSEHSQCLAILSGLLPEAKRAAAAEGLFTAKDLIRTTIYFSHYLLEACRVTGRMDAYFAKLGEWDALPGLGLKTPIEMPEPGRSDCHAWGAHPLFHARATVLGVRPAAPGFAKVEVRPQLGRLQRVSGTLPHPKGEIAVDVRREGERLVGSVRLPRGVAGNVVVNGESLVIKRGVCEFA